MNARTKLIPIDADTQEAVFEVPEGAANVSTRTELVVGQGYFLIVNWLELTREERSQFAINQMHAAAGGRKIIS